MERGQTKPTKPRNYENKALDQEGCTTTLILAPVAIGVLGVFGASIIKFAPQMVEATVSTFKDTVQLVETPVGKAVTLGLIGLGVLTTGIGYAAMGISKLATKYSEYKARKSYKSLEKALERKRRQLPPQQ